MKKLLIGVLCSLMVIGCAGCGDGDKAVDKQGETDTLLWYTLGSQQPDLPLVVEEVNKIVEPKIGAKVNMIILDESAYGERMKLMMAAGDDYDICFSGYANRYVDGIKHGGFLKLNELLDSEAPALKKAIPDYAWQAVTVSDGGIYAIPNLQCFSLPRGLHFQKELVEKYNFDYTKVNKMEDIEPFLEMVKQNEPDIYPFRAYITLSCWLYQKYENFYSIFYIDKDDPECKVYCHYELPEFWQTQSKLHEWYTKGYIRSDVSSAGDDTVDYKAGRYAVMPGSVYPGIAQSIQTLTGKEIVSAQLVKQPYISVGGATDTLNAINAHTKKPEKSIKFLELLHTDPAVYNLICKGIEGKHYTKLEDGSIRLTEGSGYAPKADWKFGNQFNALRLEGTDPSIWEDTRELDASATPSRLLGFNLDTNEISGELAQISSVQSAYNTTSGVMDMNEKKDEYINKLQQAGSEKAKELIQKQIDEFLASRK